MKRLVREELTRTSSLLFSVSSVHKLLNKFGNIIKSHLAFPGTNTFEHLFLQHYSPHFGCLISGNGTQKCYVQFPNSQPFYLSVALTGLICWWHLQTAAWMGHFSLSLINIRLINLRKFLSDTAIFKAIFICTFHLKIQKCISFFFFCLLNYTKCLTLPFSGRDFSDYQSENNQKWLVSAQTDPSENETASQFTWFVSIMKSILSLFNLFK